MAQDLVKCDLQFTAAIAKDTDTELIGGSAAATTQRMVSVISCKNNDDVSQTLTFKKKIGAGPTTVWTDTLVLTTGEQDFYVGLVGNVLEGNATNQESISVAFGTTMTASDTIDISCSVLEVS